MRIGTFGRGIWENDLLSEPGVHVGAIDQNAGIRVDLAGNPVQQSMVLNIHSSAEKEVLMEIYAIDGKLVHSEKRNITPGHYQWLIDTNNLDAGNYFFRLNGESLNLQTIQFLKI